MIFVLTGNDFDKRKKSLEELIKKYTKYSRKNFDDLNFSENDFANLISGGGLFAEKFFVVLNGVLEEDKYQKFILERIKELDSSENIFVFIEEKLSADLKKKLKKYIEEFSIKKQTEELNPFTLTNAIKRGDKKSIWVNYIKLIRAGVESNNSIAPILFWYYKSEILKGKKENKKLLNEISKIYHEGRRGLDTDTSLELFLLKNN